MSLIFPNVQEEDQSEVNRSSDSTYDKIIYSDFQKTAYYSYLLVSFSRSD